MKHGEKELNSMEMWQPARFGAKQENEVSVYTVAIPNLPIFPNRKVDKFVKWISKLDGFVGIRPEYPNGTLLLFKTKNDAKIARNKINNYPGYDMGTGNNICEVYIDRKYIE